MRAALVLLVLVTKPMAPIYAGTDAPNEIPEGAVARLGTLRLRFGFGDGRHRVRYARDGQEIWVIAGKYLQRWKAEQGELLEEKNINGKDLRSLDVKAGGQTALLGDEAGTLYEWSPGTDQPTQRVATRRPELFMARYAPDGKSALTLYGEMLHAETWDLSSGARTAEIKAAPKFIDGIYHPGGTSVFLTHQPAPNVQHHALPGGEQIKGFLSDYYCNGLAVAPDGATLLIGSRHKATIFRMNDDKPLGAFTGHHGDEVTAVAYTPDSKQILTGSRDGSLRLWTLNGNKLLRRWVPHTKRVSALWVSPDHKWALSYGCDGLLTETGLADGAPRLDRPRHASGVSALAATGTLWITASHDGTLRTWDAAKHSAVQCITTKGLEVHALALCGTRAAAGCKDGRIYFFNLPDGKPAFDLSAHAGFVYALAALPDPNWILSGGGNGAVVLWDLKTRKPVHIMTGHRGGVQALAVHPHGTTAASGGRDGTIRVWDLTTGQQSRAFVAHAGWVEALAFDSQGERLLSGGGDGEAVVWSISEAKPERVLKYGGKIGAVCWAGKTICVGGEVGEVLLWGEGNEPAARLKGHADAVLSLLALNGNRLLSGSADTTALVWTLP